MWVLTQLILTSSEQFSFILDFLSRPHQEFQKKHPDVYAWDIGHLWKLENSWGAFITGFANKVYVYALFSQVTVFVFYYAFYSQIRSAVFKSCIENQEQLGIQAVLHPHLLPPALGGSKVKDNWEDRIGFFPRENRQVKLSLQVQYANTQLTMVCPSQLCYFRSGMCSFWPESWCELYLSTYHVDKVGSSSFPWSPECSNQRLWLWLTVTSHLQECHMLTTLL